MFTEEELIRDYNFKRTQLEEQEDNIKRGEQIFNQMLEQTSYNISQMLQEAEGDVSEASQMSRYRLNQLFEEYEEKFQKEKRHVYLQLEEAEREFNQNYKELKARD